LAALSDDIQQKIFNAQLVNKAAFLKLSAALTASPTKL
jgi:hypothetical protein